MKADTPAENSSSQTASARRRLAEIVLEAAVLEGAEREAYFEEIAAENPSLAADARRRVAAAEEVSDSFLEHPAAEQLGRAHDAVEGDAVEAAAEFSPSAVLPPESRYKLGECLGRGGMGRVFEAYDHQLDRRVALKFLTSEMPSIRELFLREGRAQARVRHVHVLDIYDSGELEGQPFLAMRHVDGGTLEEVAPKLSLEHKIRLLIQVAEGLHAAHRQGLLHRDVKPSNVLVEETPDGDFTAYVSDFGIAADLADPEWLAGDAVAGSPQYIAPERLAGDQAVDRRSDIYSLGVTMYRILTGSLPFAGPLTVDVLRQAIHTELPPPRRKNPNLPLAVEAILLRCLAKSPSERYASARVVADDLRRFLDGEVVEAYAAGLAYRLTRFVLRHRLLVVLAALAALVLVVASIVVTVFALKADVARRQAEQRQDQAEELIRFMVVDLQKKLEPVSRLEVLDDISQAAVEYFAAVPEEELSEEELLRRSRMLYQLGDLRIQQGNLAGAAAPLEQSLALTRRLQELAPEDSERLFELGQSHFWVGFVAWKRAEFAAARGAFEDYRMVSQRLVDRDSENLDWQLELSYAYSNLGTVLQSEGKLTASLERFEKSLGIKLHLVRTVADNPQWHSDLADSHNTVGVAFYLLGRFSAARDHFQRELAIREDWLRETPENRRLQSDLATTHAYLGKCWAREADLKQAKESAEAGRELLVELVTHDPANSTIQNKLLWIHIDLGRFAYEAGDIAAAEREWRAAQTTADQFLASVEPVDLTQYAWRRARGVLAYHFALGHSASGDPRAHVEVQSAIEVLGSLAQPADLEVARWLGRSYLLLGSLETSPAAAGAAVERATEILKPFFVKEGEAVMDPWLDPLLCPNRL